MESLKLCRDNDPYVGWIRNPEDGPLPVYSSTSTEKLENDAIEEVIARREAKANENKQ